MTYKMSNRLDSPWHWTLELNFYGSLSGTVE